MISKMHSQFCLDVIRSSSASVRAIWELWLTVNVFQCCPVVCFAKHGAKTSGVNARESGVVSIRDQFHVFCTLIRSARLTITFTWSLKNIFVFESTWITRASHDSRKTLSDES